MPRSTSPRFRTALILLGLAALLGLDTTHAQNEKSGHDVWVGRWKVVLRFPKPKETIETWIEIAPGVRGGYVVRTEKDAGGVIAEQSPKILTVHLADPDGTLLAVRLGKSGDSFAGSVDQPGHAYRQEGTASGQRVHSFGGFFIDGPTRLRWGQTETYTLQYARNGVRRNWGGNVRWKIRSDPKQKGMLSGKKRDVTRTLTTPKEPRPFASMRITLRAEGLGNEEFSSQLRDAKLTILVTNAPEECKALAQRIRASARKVRTLRTRVAEFQARLAALRFPKPWDDSNAKALKTEIEKARMHVAQLEKNEKDARDALQRMRQTELIAARYSFKLTMIAKEGGRAFEALGWYKKSAKGKEEKATFVQIFTGKRPIRNVDSDFGIQWRRARSVAIAKVSVGIVQMGGLIAALPTGGNLRSLVESGFSIALGGAADSMIESDAALESIRIGEQAAAAFATTHGELGKLAKLHAAATSADERHEIEVRMNRAALKALRRSAIAQGALRQARPAARRALRAISNELRKQRILLAQLEDQKKKETLAAEKRLDEIQDALTRKDFLEFDLERARKRLEGEAGTLEYLQALHKKHCKPVKEDLAALPKKEFECRRGRILASSFFRGGTGGWKLDGDGKDLKAVGNHIQAKDRGKGRHWYFLAPAKFTGDKRAAYGSIMTFELNQLEKGAKTFHDRILVLSDGKTELIYTPERTLALGWTRFEVCFHESKKWTVRPKAKLDEALFLSVLGNLKSVRINCEHSTDRDVGGLRAVTLYGR